MRPALRCLVWELDNTLWDGVVCDATSTVPRPEALRTLRTLSERGIWHAVASRSDRDKTMDRLYRHGVYEMFSAIEIGWGRKSTAIIHIARTLGLTLESVAFIDAEPVERAEVAAALPSVRCYAARNVDILTALPDFGRIPRIGPDPTPPLGFARVPAH
ncbi:HAD-IIIC family phosphatase [Nocardia bovistercoris]|uniref:HAD-IIIC family phosphatase n=1 Tax=Nocardia bovistercoris TaxID=2785916 RepID=A0A931IG83_9NOCA|nr:HAD-IIIC family phosphatase [Nocardia bovistercoris]MBH0779200.1 HAD-IIIC family phosphatase [Nocardia bovistercoris]